MFGLRFTRFEKEIDGIGLIRVPRLYLLLPEVYFGWCFCIKHHHLFYYNDGCK
jgi:hypothetical protein